MACCLLLTVSYQWDVKVLQYIVRIPSEYVCVCVCVCLYVRMCVCVCVCTHINNTLLYYVCTF